LELAQLLLKEYKNVNIKDNDGQTPLQLAVDFQHTEIAECIEKHMKMAQSQGMESNKNKEICRVIISGNQIKYVFSNTIFSKS